MDMLQEDVCSLKSLLHNRVGPTETDLATVMDCQKQLKLEQKIMRDEIKEELMQEVKRSLHEEISSRALDSSLRVLAAPFVPSSAT